MKKPAMFTDVPVGSATNMDPAIISVENIVMSFTERTLTNVFSIYLYHLVFYIIFPFSAGQQPMLCWIKVSYIRIAETAA
jgi:hypothetical protein